jgi:hypothetical protein
MNRILVTGVVMVDGFIGFYSTIVSSALNTKLKQLKEKGDIKKIKLFFKTGLT